MNRIDTTFDACRADGRKALVMFVSAGDLDEEVLPSVERFGEALQASDYDSFSSELAILDGETHMSARPRAFTSGIRWVFAGEGE